MEYLIAFYMLVFLVWPEFFGFAVGKMLAAVEKAKREAEAKEANE